MKLSEVIKQVNNALEQDKKFFRNRNMLIVGKNTAGKSKMIKEIVRKNIDKGDIYFIDSKNRKITSNERESSRKFSDFKVEDILKDRTNQKYFNKEDIFSTTEGAEILRYELSEDETKYEKLFSEVLDFKLEFKKEEVPGSDNLIIYIDGAELDQLSDAQNAMLRILMEVNFASEQNCKTIIIDEFDIHLDYVNCHMFVHKLMEKYPHLYFILAVHSPYTILGLENFDILQIKLEYDNVDENECIFYESNDMDDINIIHRKLFNIPKQTNAMDILLSNALSQVIKEGKIDNSLLKRLEQEEDTFTVRQKVVYQYIDEHSRRGE